MNKLTQFPALLDLRVSWLPDWAISVALIVALVLAAWWLHALVFKVLTRAVSEQSLLRRSLVSRTEGPARLAAIMLASASNSGRAFELRCEIREKMIAFVQQRYPDALPRVRTDLSDQRAEARGDGQTAAH